MNEWEAILWFKSQTPRRRQQDEAAAFYIFTLSHKGKKNPHLFYLNIAECHFECG